MVIKSTGGFADIESAIAFIDTLPDKAKLQVIVKAEIQVGTESEIHMNTLHNLAYEKEFINAEEQDALNYAISCIKTLKDMEIIK